MSEQNLHVKPGYRFGTRTIICEVASDYYRGKRKRVFLCRCDCGAERTLRKGLILHCAGVSCGCIFGIEHHGDAGIPIYAVWNSIIARCENENSEAYGDYGGRGISICDSWRNSFQAFKTDMGKKPHGGMVERIDNDGDYCPENCRWATRLEQARNKRNNIVLTVKGQSRCIREWEDIKGMTRTTIWQRINKLHWSPERAVMTPQKRRFTRAV